MPKGRPPCTCIHMFGAGTKRREISRQLETERDDKAPITLSKRISRLHSGTAAHVIHPYTKAINVCVHKT